MAQRQLLLALGLALLLVGSGVAAEEVAAPEEAPAEATEEAAPAPEEVKERSHYWWNDVTAESQWEKPEYEYTDPETNRVYYVHPETKETSWDKYEELQWEEVEAEDGSGVYYYNEATKLSQWEKPIIFAWRQVAVDAMEEGHTLPVEEPKDEL